MTLVDDITDPEYGMPAYYTVTDTVSGKSVSVHYSRVVRFVGDELPFWEGQSEQLWGASVIESVFEELKKRDNVSWNIAQLTFMASLRVLKMNDLGQMLAASDEASQKELYNTIQAQNWLMSNMGLQVIDAADGIESHQYTFGGLSEVYQQFMMDISGAAQIPATKLFGRSPSGMNATGESDLQNYYEMIGQEQESKLRPILNKILPVLCMSVFGAVPDDLDFDFDPVSEPSDKERSDLAKSGTENVVAALNAGLVSKRTALKELKQQSERTGVWTNITDQDIMNASDEIEEEGEMGGMPGIPDFQDEEVKETGKNAGDFSGNSDFKPKSDNLPEETPEKAKLTQDSENKWVTMNGTHVKVDKSGIMKNGPMKGQKYTPKQKAPKYTWNHVLIFAGYGENGERMWVHSSGGQGVILNSPSYEASLSLRRPKNVDFNAPVPGDTLGTPISTLEVDVTHYCACAKCCGSNADGITASGKQAARGMVAMSSHYPFGTQIMINGTMYTVEDRGGSGIENDIHRVDIFVPDHNEALRLGRYKTTATIYRIGR